MKFKLLFVAILFLQACREKLEKTKPSLEPITESIYASGIIKSKNQYQAFANVNGIVDTVFLSEGDTVEAGTPVLSITSQSQKLNSENAELAAGFADAEANQGKVNAAKLLMELAFSKLKHDSIMFVRQSSLWQQKVGTQVEFEQRQLAYQNSVSTYYSAMVNYQDVKRQVSFYSAQSKKLLSISKANVGDYVLKSEIKGIVYSIEKSKGEIVTPQTPVAVIGDARQFILEMQVDEMDIIKIRKGQTVIVTMDSYKGKVFEASVTKIDPLMNERSKTFIVEATFKEHVPLLYPNTGFESSIIVQTKNKAVLIPRNYLVNDSTVLNSKNEQIRVKTGLRDYQKVEIISGLKVTDEIVKPVE